MSISYEEAVDTLASIFPSWERDTLIAIFQGNDFHIERTIEAVLVMEGQNIGDSNVGITQNIDPASQNAQSEADMQMAMRLSSQADASLPPPPSRVEQNDNSRGIKISLPETFLRPPGWRAMMADEQLALMLQDEIFQREVVAAMGAQGPQFVGSPGYQRRIRQNQLNNQQQQPLDNDQMPDLGILKGIQEMGEGMKKQLNILATRFKARSAGTGRDESSIETFDQRNPMTAEHVPLVQRDEQYEEEDDISEAEIINFDSPTNNNHRGAHSLNDELSQNNNRRTAMISGGGGGGGKKDK